MVGMAGMDWGTFDREDFDAKYRDAMEAKHPPKQTAETEKEQVETRRVDCSCGESYYSDGTVPERHRDCPTPAITDLVSRLRRWHRVEPPGVSIGSPLCMSDGQEWPCDTIRLIDVAETARDALVILAALDLSVQWELAPEVKAKIHDATTRLTAALTALVDTSRREIEPDAHP